MDVLTAAVVCVCFVVKLARANDRELYRKDALALRREMTELGGELQKHQGDEWKVAVEELEKRLLEDAEVCSRRATCMLYLQWRGAGGADMRMQAPRVAHMKSR